jgi:hypothetical protein
MIFVARPTAVTGSVIGEDGVQRSAWSVEGRQQDFWRAAGRHERGELVE